MEYVDNVYTLEQYEDWFKTAKKTKHSYGCITDKEGNARKIKKIHDDLIDALRYSIDKEIKPRYKLTGVNKIIHWLVGLVFKFEITDDEVKQLANIFSQFDDMKRTKRIIDFKPRMKLYRDFEGTLIIKRGIQPVVLQNR